MFKKIINIAEKELEIKIDENKSFQENNFDSMDQMTFIAICEDHFKIKFTENDYKLIKDFSSLEKLIKKKIPK